MARRRAVRKTCKEQAKRGARKKPAGLSLLCGLAPTRDAPGGHIDSHGMDKKTATARIKNRRRTRGHIQRCAGAPHGVRIANKVHAAVWERMADGCEGLMTGGFVYRDNGHDARRLVGPPAGRGSWRPSHGGRTRGRQFNCSSRAGEFQNGLAGREAATRGQQCDGAKSG